jgi:hypothetical protein
MQSWGKYLPVDFNEEPGSFLAGWSAWKTVKKRQERRERGRKGGREEGKEREWKVRRESGRWGERVEGNERMRYGKKREWKGENEIRKGQGVKGRRRRTRKLTENTEKQEYTIGDRQADKMTDASWLSGPRRLQRVGKREGTPQSITAE